MPQVSKLAFLKLVQNNKSVDSKIYFCGKFKLRFYEWSERGGGLSWRGESYCGV